MDQNGDVGDEASRILRTAGSITWVAYWTLRVLAGSLVLLYGLSFVAPPPVEAHSLSYDDDPAEVAYDAVHNLRTGTYHYTIETSAMDRQLGERAGLEVKATIDNRARQYSRQFTFRDVGEPPDGWARIYGTRTVGFTPRGPDSLVWVSFASDAYKPSKNAFRNIKRIRRAQARVLTDNRSWFVVEVQGIAPSVARPPEIDHERDDVNRTTVVFGIDKRTDRLAWARYRATGDSGTFLAHYRFHRGWLMDVDRPVWTYPPGGELLPRINLGIEALDAAIPGGGA